MVSSFYRDALEKISVPVVILESYSKKALDFKVRYANTSAQEMTGISLGQARGGTTRQLFPEISEEFYEVAYRVLLEGGAARVEHASYENQFGEYFVLQINIRRIGKRLMVSAENYTSSEHSNLQTFHQSSYDPLTSLLVREAFLENAETEIKANKRRGDASALILIDLDGFKQINDTLGHGAGDSTLAEIATNVTSCLRHQDLAGRLGGDEMVFLLSNISLDTAKAAAGRILKEIKLSGEGDVAGSAGVVIITPKNKASLKELLSVADKAMYEAKRAGGNRSVIKTRK